MLLLMIGKIALLICFFVGTSGEKMRSHWMVGAILSRSAANSGMITSYKRREACVTSVLCCSRRTGSSSLFHAEKASLSKSQ